MIESSPASISFDVDALGNIERRIDWKRKQKSIIINQSTVHGPINTQQVVIPDNLSRLPGIVALHLAKRG